MLNTGNIGNGKSKPPIGSPTLVSSTIMKSTTEGKFGYLVAVAFTINYIVGTGFLTIPWAFSQAGCILSIIALICTMYGSIASAHFILESMTRSETLYQLQHIDVDEVPLVNSANIQPKESSIGNKKFDVTEMCLIFLGPFGRQLYTFSLSLYLYCTLVAYSTVFASAFSSHFHIFGDSSYFTYLFLFGLMVIPLSCAELNEQITLQVTLAIGRMLMFLFMVCTLLYAFLWNKNPFNGYAYIEHQHLLYIDYSKLSTMLPIIVYAYIFHHSIPEISNPVRNKGELGSIYTTTIISVFVSYLILGVLVSLYFGKSTPSSANLLWSTYAGLEPSNSPSLFGAIVSGFTVIFPAFDVSSCFPLCAITLGNNIMSAFYGENIHLYDQSRWRRISFRLIASIPPVLIAFIVTDLGAITHVSGICGFAVAFIFPSLLSFYSEKKMIEMRLPIKTPYSNIFTNHISRVFTFSSSVFFIIALSLISLISYLSE